MKVSKYNFKKWVSVGLRTLGVFGALLLVTGLQAQADCACKEEINVTLDANCSFTLNLDIVGAGACAQGGSVIVSDGNPSNGPVIDCAGFYSYVLLDREGEGICWGRVRAEDKTGPQVTREVNLYPELDCHLIDILVNNPKTIEIGEKYYLGQVTFSDNCGDGSCRCNITRTFSDQLIYNDCGTILQSNVYVRMVRKWKAVDCMGNETVYDQFFDFKRPSLDDLSIVSDTTYQSCSVAEVQVLDRYPYWTDAFGDRFYLNENICNYATTLTGEKFDVCLDGTYKERVNIEVLDWCTGNSRVIGSYLNKIGDFEGAAFSGNAMNISSNNILNDLRRNVDMDSLFILDTIDGKMPILSTGPIDCSASISLGVSSLQAQLGFEVTDCSDFLFNAKFYSYLSNEVYGIPTGGIGWKETTYPIFSGLANGIPVGIHALIMVTNDNCHSSSTGILFFKVQDKVAPIPKCTDRLNISVTSADPNYYNGEAFGRVYPSDIDEGTWDNCELGTMRLRRSVSDLAACEATFINAGFDGNKDGRIDEEDWYDVNGNGEFDEDLEYKWAFINGTWYTPWREYADFFCCDIGQSVSIEFGAWDNAVDPLSGEPMPNLNSCWQTTVVEDNTVPRFSSLPTINISCTDSLAIVLKHGEITGNLLDTVREHFGEAFPFGVYCGNFQLREYINDERDLCGFGIMERIIEVEKNTPNKPAIVGTMVQEIRVIKVFDYSICFPADIDTTCVGIGDTIATQLAYETAGCDLLAVSYRDNQFEVSPGGDACYKIFRTYKVVNWCEYDGESLPVIVGRDWDDWQGCSSGVPGDEDFEYNINPLRPDGDNRPGDEGICITVKRDFFDDERDVVYYDRNMDPFDAIPNDPDTRNVTEGYWWKVVSGSTNPNSSSYYSGGYRCSNTGVWDNDPNRPSGGNDAADDDDIRYGSNGFWQYTQHIKVFDSSSPVAQLVSVDTVGIDSNVDCAADFSMMINALDDCTGAEDLRIFVSLDEDNNGGNTRSLEQDLTGNKLETRLPLGTHRILVRVSDYCGNSVSLEKLIVVADQKAPNPICLSGLIVELMPSVDGGGFMTVWASDFIASAIGDCSGQGPEQAPVGIGFSQPVVTDYSINRVGTSAIQNETGLTVTCDDLQGLVPIELHAWDRAGNHGYCNSFIQVQDNQNICDESLIGSGILAGKIAKEDLKEVEGVNVELSGVRSVSYQTDVSGEFLFRNLAEGYDYTITPKLDRNALNGVSTFDLVLISKHILGSSQLDNPYKLIAADVNRSKTVTTLDLIQLRKVILRIDTEFATNTSWRFVEAGHVFPEPNNPWLTSFPEFKNINNLEGVEEMEFVAVKIGDVNNSAVANSAQRTTSRTTAGTLEILTDNLELKAGEEYQIPFRADLQGISGYQFSMFIDPTKMTILDLEEGLTKTEHFGFFPGTGVLTTSFNQDLNRGTGVETLFSLRVKAKVDGVLSRQIQINSTYTEAEAYNTSDEVLAVVLSLGGNLNTSDENQLMQNQPNPFQSETNIGFYLEKPGAVELSIKDVNGRLVKSIQANYDAGFQQVQLNRTDLPNSGLYFYQLRVDGFVETKQMILIE